MKPVGVEKECCAESLTVLWEQRRRVEDLVASGENPVVDPFDLGAGLDVKGDVREARAQTRVLPLFSCWAEEELGAIPVRGPIARLPLTYIADHRQEFVKVRLRHLDVRYVQSDVFADHMRPSSDATAPLSISDRRPRLPNAAVLCRA
jgi:hypothetical protein